MNDSRMAGSGSRWVPLVFAAILIASSAVAQEAPPVMSDWGGTRTLLRERYGVTLGINYIGEVLDVVSGGIRRDASFEGRLELVGDVDLEKLVGWRGASAHTKIFQIHNGGRNAADNVGSIFDPSNIDALRTTRLFTAWFQQNFHGDMISIRAGQLAADDEFLTSGTAGGLINGTFGWAAINAANIRSGGPAYPLATPGVRLQLKPVRDVTLLGAVFSGDPAGANCTVNPQICNRHGTTFSTSGGALWIGEAQLAVNSAPGAAGLPGVYKVGVWHATAHYNDLRFGFNSGVVLSLADPAMPAAIQHNGNTGFYGVADQTIWRSGERSINIFLRAGVVPTDRNLVSSYVDGGIGIKGLFDGRPDDLLTFGIAHGNIGANARGFDRDMLAFNGPPFPIRDHETLFELSYLWRVTPWWSIQPDLQYIVHPGGRIPHPLDATRTIGDTFSAGVRTTINF
jgi:porin